MYFLLPLVILCTIHTLGAQKLIQPGDLAYLGGFRLPSDTTGGSRFGYGGTAPVFHDANQSLFMVGHDWHQKVAEVTIPELIVSDDIGDLNTADMLQPFREISEGLMFTVDEGTIKVGGLLVDSGDLIGSAYTYYDADGDQVLSHFASDTSITIEEDAIGMFQLGEDGAGYVSGYMTRIPEEWQDTFGGPVITGQCCIPIISRTSYGPAAFVFDPADLDTGSVTGVTPLVYYPSEHPLAEWSATDPWFNGTTQITGIVIPPGSRSLLFFGNHGIGEFCYGTGEDCDDPVYGSQGSHAYPYVYQVWGYDLYDLLDAKNGLVEPYEVMPYAVWQIDFPVSPGNKQIGGATIDTASGRIFVSQMRVDGLDAFPLVHGFTVRGPNIFVDSSATGIGNGTSWDDAYTDLQDALDIAHAGDTIRIAKGTYFPDRGKSYSPGDRTAVFSIDPGVVITGGYPQGGGIRNIIENIVVLSGDIDANDSAVPAQTPADVTGENSYTILHCTGGKLDGLFISGGLANGTDAGDDLQKFAGGAYTSGDIEFIDCVFSGNIAFGNGTNGRGGGLYHSSGILTFRNTTFLGNSASEEGMAIFVASGATVIRDSVEVGE